MTDCVFTSRTDVVTYVAEMATELARLADAAQCDRLAYLLEVAATEAKSVIPLNEGDETTDDALVAGGDHRRH